MRPQETRPSGRGGGQSPKHGINYYPFGGRKDSGIGREGIGYSIEQVTAMKSIVYNYKGKGIWDYI